MTSHELLVHVRDRGARVSLQDGRVRVTAPRDSLEEELWQALARQKEELRQLLERELRAEQRPVLKPQDRPGNLPLSFAQRRLWIIDRLKGGSAEYNLPDALRLHGELRHDVLARTINTIVQRHESLRTRFAEVNGEPMQIIDPALPIYIPVEDLSGLDDAARQVSIRAAMVQEWQTPFNLEIGPLLRVRILKLAPDDHILLRTFHHIVSDGWSTGVFNSELISLYEAFLEGHESPLPTLAVQYPDFTLWQRSCLAGESLERGLEYWRQQLSGIPQELELSFDRPRPPKQTYSADVSSMRLSNEQVSALNRIGNASQATLYMILLAAYAVLLHRYSGERDIVIGSPVANRQEPQLEQLIGFFVNALALRVRVNPVLTFRDLLSAVRDTTLDAYLHQDIPFERLVEELAPERNMTSTPLVQVVFTMHNAPPGARRLRGIEVAPIAMRELRVRYDLELHAYDSGSGLELSFVYNSDLFDRWRIDQMARFYVRVLDLVVREPDAYLSSYIALSAEERRDVIPRCRSSLRSKRLAVRIMLRSCSAQPHSRIAS
jgi:Condensation domain/TubC N-terminal docking domain